MLFRRGKKATYIDVDIVVDVAHGEVRLRRSYDEDGRLCTFHVQGEHWVFLWIMRGLVVVSVFFLNECFTNPLNTFYLHTCIERPVWNTEKSNKKKKIKKINQISNFQKSIKFLHFMRSSLFITQNTLRCVLMVVVNKAHTEVKWNKPLRAVWALIAQIKTVSTAAESSNDATVQTPDDTNTHTPELI